MKNALQQFGLLLSDTIFILANNPVFIALFLFGLYCSKSTFKPNVEPVLSTHNNSFGVNFYSASDPQAQCDGFLKYSEHLFILCIFISAVDALHFWSYATFTFKQLPTT